MQLTFWRKYNKINKKKMLNPKDRFPRAGLDCEKGENLMKRAFIRLFGCILSAIGLSMSYDTTFTILLDDESAPGALWASGTGTGSGATIPGTLLAGLSGNCSYEGMNVSYEVYLSDYWYVGWLNLNYAGSGGVPYDIWPTVCEALSTFNTSFSGSSLVYDLIGGFASTTRGSGNVYDSRKTVDLCTGKYGYVIGMATGLGEGTADAIESWRNQCVMDTRSPNCTYNQYSYGAVYLPASAGFNNMGCCYVTSSSYATGTGCKCFYGPADRAYTYTYVSKSNTNTRTTTTTVPFRDVFLDFSYGGCKAGWYSKANIAANTQFVQALMSDKTLAINMDYDGVHQPCPQDLTSQYLSLTFETLTTHFTDFWDNCDACYAMTSISNSSSFSPTITSNGTMSLTASDSGTGISTCNATVKGAKDATGTFDVVGSCSYN